MKDQPSVKKKLSKKTQPPPDLDPRLKFRMGLALMGEENVHLYLAFLEAAGKTRLREEALNLIASFDLAG